MPISQPSCIFNHSPEISGQVRRIIRICLVFQNSPHLLKLIILSESGEIVVVERRHDWFAIEGANALLFGPLTEAFEVEKVLAVLYYGDLVVWLVVFEAN